MNVQLENVLTIVTLVFGVLCFVVSSWTIKTMVIDDRIYSIQRLLLLVLNLAWFGADLFNFYLFHEISSLKFPLGSFILMIMSLGLFLSQYRSKGTNIIKTPEDKVVEDH